MRVDHRKLGTFGAAAAIVAAALVLRTVAPGADPPRWLTTSLSDLVDGPWYVAAAADPEVGASIPASYRRPVYLGICRGVFAVAGARLETFALPSALAGAFLAGAMFVALRRAAGEGGALLAAGFVAFDAVLVGWSRTAVPYPLLALFLALGLAAALRAGAAGLGAGAGLVALAAWGVKPIAAIGLAPLAALGLAPLATAGATPTASRRRAAGALAAAAALVLVAAAIGRAGLADAWARLVLYAGGDDLDAAGLVRRLLHFPVAAGLFRLAPVPVILALAAPVFLRGRFDAAARAAAAWTLAGALTLAPLAQPNMPYVVAFWPGALALAALSLRALAAGGAPPLRRPALATFGVAAALAFTALGEVGGHIDALGDRFYFGSTRFLWTLVGALAAGAIAAAIAARRPPREAPSPPRPRLAAALAGAHLLWQVALVGAYLLHPGDTLRAARADAAAALPPGARIGEQFALALGLDAPAAETYFFFDPARKDEIARARAAGITHVAATADRISSLLRLALGRTPDVVASVYIAGERVRIARLEGILPSSPFERGRDLLERGDLPGARAALEAAVFDHPRAHLPRVHLAFAAALGGDLATARREIAAARDLAPDSFPAGVASVLVEMRDGRPARALAEAEAALALFPARDLERFRRDLAAALAAGDETALATLRGTRAMLLGADLLR